MHGYEQGCANGLKGLCCTCPNYFANRLPRLPRPPQKDAVAVDSAAAEKVTPPRKVLHVAGNIA